MTSFHPLLGFFAVLLGCVAGCAHTAARDRSDDASGRLWGTAWRLEQVAGAPVVDGVAATLEFPEEGKAAGNGSCNRFAGTVEVSGRSITFGPLASTRMACADPIGHQEAAYLAALAEAERFVVDGTALAIYARGMNQPLRFARTKP